MGRMTLNQKSYQNATLSIEKAMWRICWYNTNPNTGKLERVRRTFNLNRIKDLQERKQVANDLIYHINILLSCGYNDFLTPEENAKLLRSDLVQKKLPVLQIETPKVTIVAALEKALRIRLLGKAHRTVGVYRSFVHQFTNWLTENNLQGMPVETFSAEHWHDFMDYKARNGSANRNINDYTNFFKTTFDVVKKKLKYIHENPLAEIDYLPKKDSTLFETITPEEIERIVPALEQYNPRFYLYTKFIAYQFIRPHHAVRLKAGDIDYRNDTIHVSGETTKNRKSRFKQLLPPVKEMLLLYDYDKLSPDTYLFSNRCFEPGKVLQQNLSIRAAEIWRKLIIEGLGINKKMYALKHTSSQYFVNENANADLKFLQHHMEHHSFAQTEIYLQDKIHKTIDLEKTNFIKY